MLAQIVKVGAPIPEGLHDAGEVRPGDELYWRAFHDLSTCRPTSEMPIPWSAVQLWASSYRLDSETTETLHEVIRGLDAEFLEFVAEKQEKSRRTDDNGKNKPQ